MPVYIRRLLQLCIRYDAQHVLLAHNHPSTATLPPLKARHCGHPPRVEMALESIDATLNDHIIFAGDDYHSFAKSGWLWTANGRCAASAKRSCRLLGRRNGKSCGEAGCCKASAGGYFGGKAGKIFSKALTRGTGCSKMKSNICSHQLAEKGAGNMSEESLKGSSWCQLPATGGTSPQAIQQLVKGLGTGMKGADAAGRHWLRARRLHHGKRHRPR